MKLRFVILPPTRLAKYTGKLALNYASRFPVVYAVDNKKFQPHITLFDVEISIVDFKTVLTKAKRLFKDIRAPKVIISGPWIYKPHQVLGVDVKADKNYSRFRESLKKSFGDAAIKGKTASFAHITLNKFQNLDDLISCSKTMRAKIFKFRPTMLGIGVTDKYGQFEKRGKKHRIIQKCKLK
ncbi:MAG: hypothetical protein COT91_03315 [Candidatus Doudnabacteria bacterium CG10_big_fil_rev_8_21_14_0_10_41_10]|uniref:2'-5' RNA ligase n=1 Tax=Candidatus Doudnabacteria bacterium CG10_big_fil_rev_8_21_14_0_10_41_10 TaxID=1974551 RepID=A0A2H0VDD6_9BACT|nr:MAG: hypothetical protein COT91_03315 [Candidatus Doudnabacteria bacterium CG10_big_fil_rev_8_21_14_0_10_41_10]